MPTAGALYFSTPIQFFCTFVPKSGSVLPRLTLLLLPPFDNMLSGVAASMWNSSRNVRSYRSNLFHPLILLQDTSPPTSQMSSIPSSGSVSQPIIEVGDFSSVQKRRLHEDVSLVSCSVYFLIYISFSGA